MVRVMDITVSNPVFTIKQLVLFLIILSSTPWPHVNSQRVLPPANWDFSMFVYIILFYFVSLLE